MTLRTPACESSEEAEDRLPEPGRPMTEDEFAGWCLPKTRAEWVDGEVVLMPPVSYGHADLNAWLLAILRAFVRARQLGTVLGPEFFIRFETQRRRRLPDLMFVSSQRQDLIRKQYVDGAPDLIVEIVSPDSEARDWREKYLEYERAGVREYWVNDPMSAHVEAYALTPGGYARIHEQDGKLVSQAIPGLHVRPQWLWQNPLPSELDVLRELGA